MICEITVQLVHGDFGRNVTASGSAKHGGTGDAIGNEFGTEGEPRLSAAYPQLVEYPVFFLHSPLLVKGVDINVIQI
jgi:hypothetical protein